MESFLSRYKNALVLILVLLLQVIGVAIQVRRPLPKEHAQPDAGGVRLIRYWAISLVSPPERFVHWLGASILGVWDNYIDLIHVRQENKDLQAEMRRLRIQEGAIAEDARQGQRLQELLSFKEKYIYKTLPAQIIGTSGIEQSRILSIDKGAKDGVAVDMPVITPNGIVGRVREVFPHTSQVLEITDPTSGAGVILATTRIRGILRGNALGQPQVVGVMPDDRIKPGEAVVTSGGDQIFPRGLAVGYVDHIVVDPEHDPLVDVVIRPAANLSQLEEVLIITNMGDEITPRQKLDMIQSEAVASAEQLKASEILAEKLPSRIDPDNPDSDTGSNDKVMSEDSAVANPMRPPPALHPDRFSPNTTPPASSLIPGARLAPQSDGVVTVARPRPAIPATTNGTTATAAQKKGTDLAPGEHSRPPATTQARPAAQNAAAGVIQPHLPATTQPHPAATVNAGHGSENGHTFARPLPSTNGQNRTEAATPAKPKTIVVVDGPLPGGVKKPAPTFAPKTPSGTAPAQHAPGTQPQHPASHKGPELVPDDGSRPPPSMLKPKPQSTAPAQPHGGRP